MFIMEAVVCSDAHTHVNANDHVQGSWKFSAATVCSKTCGRGVQEVAYQCRPKNGLKQGSGGV